MDNQLITRATMAPWIIRRADQERAGLGDLARLLLQLCLNPMRRYKRETRKMAGQPSLIDTRAPMITRATRAP